ncbi:uncharacterized protein SCDLUD_000675 [Saccharomycodes ludwigii]|uniref:uncharacterized protein n=1 Tax=Saccharomycodes ludwigii TaxID=36035 RepID=UPI001E860960|nr:hypothetical protein SCDLUD_000675 [Saccharomycodes ludwigii]KAH3903064.1 hypothetical protein SCDLUD_000675 [Saccharomycodes ludwigii]
MNAPLVFNSTYQKELSAFNNSPLLSTPNMFSNEEDLDNAIDSLKTKFTEMIKMIDQETVLLDTESKFLMNLFSTSTVAQENESNLYNYSKQNSNDDLNTYSTDNNDYSLESENGNDSTGSFCYTVVNEIIDVLDKIQVENLQMVTTPASKMKKNDVVLIKSPNSIKNLWIEYYYKPKDWPESLKAILKDQTSKTHSFDPAEKGFKYEELLQREYSIKELEEAYGSAWRSHNKNLSRQINRRKKIWNTIEEGIVNGIELVDCLEVLEKYLSDAGKGLSYFYNGVPFKISELYLQDSKSP